MNRINRPLGAAATLLVAIYSVGIGASSIFPGMIPAALAAAPTSVTIVSDFQSELGCTGDLQPDCATTHLTYDAADDVWQGTWTIPAGSWSYKAAIDNSFDENYGAGAVANGPQISLNLGASTIVKFYYDPNSHWVTSNHNSRIVTAPGSFQSDLGCPGDWQPDCLRSWLEDSDGDGTYTRSTTALPVGNYDVKATINETWDEYYGLGGAGGGDIPFTVPVNNALVTFRFVSATNILTVVVDDATDPTTSNVNVTLRQGGQINSYPVLINWTASDDVTADAALHHKVQVRRWLNGAWGSWSGFGTVTGIPAVTGDLPFWRTFQFRVRTRDEAGNWGAWALSNTINGWRRQERHFSLGTSWSINSTAGAMRGKTANSSVVGARASAHFEGNGAAVVMPVEPGLGTAQICIDPGRLTRAA